MPVSGKLVKLDVLSACCESTH
uniref:Uncharacterized protein n=1 Tax=Arundo donax TaxID=35708 RepID=A0A0A9GEZ3_ARUDO